MLKDEIKKLQTSALSRVTFCFKALKKNPPLQWTNDVIGNNIEDTKQNYKNLALQQKRKFTKTLYYYLYRESTTEARIMLIINYLSALLIKGKNNQISIHKNFTDRIQEIEEFEKTNKDLLNRLKIARDKFYAHIDLDWQSYTKSITFDEFEICINYLNQLFDKVYL